MIAVLVISENICETNSTLGILALIAPSMRRAGRALNSGENCWLIVSDTVEFIIAATKTM